MLITRRLVLPLIALLLAMNGYAYSQQTPANSRLGSIKGRVLSDGQAITNATVTVSSVNSARQSRGVPTNDNGDFEVKGLDAGMYRVQVWAPAYVSVPADPEQEIYRVGDSVTLNMVKGGVITGKIVTADNDPVVAVRVRALMIRDASGRRPTSAVESPDRFTDDRGVYRIFGLVPGTYVVFAGGRGFSGTGANAYDKDAPTFAPSSTRDTAEEITLATGEERTADIRYRGTDGHSVSGNVSVPATTDAPWITINLDRIVKSTLDLRLSTYQRAGTKGFDFYGVADGDYFIWAVYSPSVDARLLSEPKRITVKGGDVSGLELIVKPLASVEGQVVLELSTIAECKQQRHPFFRETLVSLQRNKKQPSADQPLEPSYYGSSQASADAMGRFQLRNLAAGQYSFNVWALAPLWYLRSATLPPAVKDSPATDLTRSTLTLKSGDRVTGLKATIAEGAASISGQVELPEDRPSGRIAFYVMPAEKDKGDDILRYFAVAVGGDGSFSMNHVPPGRYWTIAKLVTAENEPDVTALRLPSAAAARARLRREAEAAKSEIELKPCQSVRDHKVPLASN
ncbi:MAG TPA: carboxypeptidase-like regulatory domain-containing protein [Pyrinomonadaceae bacterium]|nr:carboxypeptidase-like regulatory domain-containing protein [Pyrinomonadaceae bacterium]